MNIYSFFSSIAFCVYLFLGISILSLDRKSSVNILFFLLNFTLAIWSLIAVFAFSTRDKDTFIILYRMGIICSICSYGFSLHFCFVLTEIYKIKPIFYSIIYIPSIILIIKNIFGFTLYKDFLYINNTWKFVLNKGSFWCYSLLAYVYIYTILSILLLFITSIKSKIKRKKKHATFLFFGFLVEMFIGTIIIVLIPVIFKSDIIDITYILFLIWMLTIGYSIIRYRFMRITPKLISTDILKSIDESFILLDNNLNIKMINKKSEEIIENNFKNQSLSEIIYEHKQLINRISKMIKKNYISFSCRINYLKKDSVKVLMDSKISLVKDKFNDVIGIYIISKEVKELKQFKTIYSITDREAEIIENIIYGNSNKEMSDKLNISENTIKTHIVNIYNKLIVNNRMELLNLIKDFNIFPEKNADKTLLIFNNDK